MLATEKKNKINKLLKIAILGLWACGLFLEFRPAQAESFDTNQVDLSLTAFSLALSDSARIQMYTLLPVPYVSHKQDTTSGYQTNQPSHYINRYTTSADYSSYRLDRSYPGVGMRYSVEQQWFVYGETRMTNYRPLASEPQLFHPDEPRSILVGGGIHF